jgi:hypothetical protein
MLQAEIHLKNKQTVMQDLMQPDLEIQPVIRTPITKSKSAQTIREPPKEIKFSNYFVSNPF